MTLAVKLNELHATNFVLYLKAHKFHWNVEGPNFVPNHEFLGEIYETLHGHADGLAELVRTLDQYAIGSIVEFTSQSKVLDSVTTVTDFTMMLSVLSQDITSLIQTYYDCYEMAEQQRQIGVSNHLQNNITELEKLRWKIRSFSIKIGIPAYTANEEFVQRGPKIVDITNK